jgi:hypothetical protein
MPYLACSITVGEPAAGPTSLEDLIGSLSQMCHEGALQHFGRTRVDCAFRAFAGERKERQAFVAFMETVNTPPDHVAKQLALWDQADRPVAIVHWFEAMPT